MMWNHEVDRALVSQVPEPKIRQIKKEFITDRIRNSIKALGNCPELLDNIIRGATNRLALLIHDVLKAARELKNKLFYEALEKEYGSKAVIKTDDTVEVVTTPVKEVITEYEPSIATITASATKNEEILTLKAGLSGIVRQHGFATVQDFYTAFYTAKRATDAYQQESTKWEEAYGEKATPKSETMHDKIKRYQEKADKLNASQPYRSRDKGAR